MGPVTAEGAYPGARALRGCTLPLVPRGTRTTGVREKLEVLGLRTTVGDAWRGDRVLLEVTLGRVVVRDGVVTRMGVVRTDLAARGRATFDGELETLRLGADFERLALLERWALDLGRLARPDREPLDFARDMLVDRDERADGLLLDRDAFDLPADGLARLPDDALRGAFEELRFGGAPANAVAPTSETAANDAVISQVQDLRDGFICHPQSA